MSTIQIHVFIVNKKEKVVKTRLENIYCTDVFDTFKNGKLRSVAAIIPQNPATLQEETF